MTENALIVLQNEKDSFVFTIYWTDNSTKGGLSIWRSGTLLVTLVFIVFAFHKKSK